MSRLPSLIALAASNREQSFNRKLIRAAIAMVPPSEATVTLVDLRDFPMPIYEGDLEAREGIPAPALELKRLFAEHNGILLSLPEYNGGVTPLFKNTFDWASRPVDGKPGLEWARNKPVGLLSASNGMLGGLRGLYHARWTLQVMGMIVLPTQKALARAATAFAEDGTLVEAREADGVRGVVTNLIDITRRLSAGA